MSRKCFLIRSLIMIVMCSTLACNSVCTSASAKSCRLLGSHFSDNGDRVSWIKQVKSDFENYTTYHVTKDEYYGPENLKSRLASNNIIFLCTHGTKDVIAVKREDKAVEYVTKEELYELDLNNLDLCFLNVCQAAYGNSRNVAAAIRTAGANTVIGFTETIDTNLGNEFTKKFARKITKYNMTVLDALTESNWEMREAHPYDVGGTDSWLIYGKKYQTFS